MTELDTIRERIRAIRNEMSALTRQKSLLWAELQTLRAREWRIRSGRLVSSAIIEHLTEHGPTALTELMRALPKVSYGSLRTTLTNLVQTGKIARVERGVYEVKN